MSLFKNKTASGNFNKSKANVPPSPLESWITAHATNWTESFQKIDVFVWTTSPWNLYKIFSSQCPEVSGWNLILVIVISFQGCGKWFEPRPSFSEVSIIKWSWEPLNRHLQSVSNTLTGHEKYVPMSLKRESTATMQSDLAGSSLTGSWADLWCPSGLHLWTFVV